MRSGLVGISLRWRLAMLPSASMTTALLKSVLPRCRSISLKPATIDDAAAAGDVAQRAQAVAAEVDGVCGEGAVHLGAAAMSSPGRSRQIQVG